jgi:hypothetical protein
LELGQEVLLLLSSRKDKVLALGAEAANHIVEVGVELDALAGATNGSSSS